MAFKTLLTVFTIVACSGLLVTGRPLGLDVSDYQGNVDWKSVVHKGAKFAYVKATQSIDFQNPYFAQQYEGSYYAGLIRGSYHFAIPSATDGATQARYFVKHGGAWSPDGKTLPGALDLESDKYYPTCYGLSHRKMVHWIRAFADEYKAKTSRDVVIYTSAIWWKECTGNSAAFGKTNPLWTPESTYGLPAGWHYYTFLQSTTGSKFPGDQDSFNGAADRLRVLACDGRCHK